MRAIHLRRSRLQTLGALALAALLVVPFAGAFQDVAEPRLVSVASAFPTGDRGTSIVLIEHIVPRETRAGIPFEYRLRLTNLTAGELREMVLQFDWAPSMDVRGFDKQPTRRDARSATWEIIALRPQATLTLSMNAICGQVGESAGCAKISFAGQVCAPIRAVQPALELVKSAPPAAMVCDEIPLRYVVSNPGSGAATRVRIGDPLPNGWTTREGSPDVGVDVGTLAPGESKQFTVIARAAATGSFESTATAISAEELRAQSAAGTRVVRPALRVSQSVPGERYVGRPAKVEITVENTGDADARDTVVFAPLPNGAQFVNASDNGQFGGGGVQWNLGTLPPAGRRSISFTLGTSAIGQFNLPVSAKAYCAEGQAEAPLLVRGIPAILLEVIDIEDPIEVGQNEVYEIQVTNQGSAADTNIRIAATVPGEATPVSGEGPTRGTVAGQQVVFDPLPSLAPKARVVYRVTVRGNQVGDVRFKVSMTSDETATPVEETESTRIY